MIYTPAGRKTRRRQLAKMLCRNPRKLEDYHTSNIEDIIDLEEKGWELKFQTDGEYLLIHPIFENPYTQYSLAVAKQFEAYANFRNQPVT